MHVLRNVLDSRLSCRLEPVWMPSQLFTGSVKTSQQKVVVAQVSPDEVTKDTGDRGAIPKRANRTCERTCKYSCKLFAVATFGAPTSVGVHVEA